MNQVSISMKVQSTPNGIKSKTTIMTRQNIYNEIPKHSLFWKWKRSSCKNSNNM